MSLQRSKLSEKQPILKGYMRDCIFIIFLKWGHLSIGEQISGYQGNWIAFGEGGKSVCLYINIYIDPPPPLVGSVVLCLSHINIIILVVILYYDFKRCYHWEKLGKAFMEFLRIIFCNFMSMGSHRVGHS